jgi:hypothetical protein
MSEKEEFNDQGIGDVCTFEYKGKPCVCFTLKEKQKELTKIQRMILEKASKDFYKAFAMYAIPSDHNQILYTNEKTIQTTVEKISQSLDEILGQEPDHE